MHLKKPVIIERFEDFILTDKPFGLLSVKGRGDLENEPTAYEILKKEFKELYTVHRLDKDTSGLMLFALNEKAHKELSSLFEKRAVEKNYSALVWGKPPKRKDLIEKRIKEFSSGRSAVDFDGKDCVTEYAVQEYFREVSLLDVFPKTGRRHQIRVHLYSLGNPIVGDRFYGDIKKNSKYPRLMLHSKSIKFSYGGKDYFFKKEPDNIFKSTLACFG